MTSHANTGRKQEIKHTGTRIQIDRQTDRPCTDRIPLASGVNSLPMSKTVGVDVVGVGVTADSYLLVTVARHNEAVLGGKALNVTQTITLVTRCAQARARRGQKGKGKQGQKTRTTLS